MVIYHSWFYHFTTTCRPDLTLSYDGPACMVIYHWSPDSVTLLPRAGLTWPSAMMVEPAWWSITDLLILSLYYTVPRAGLTWPSAMMIWSLHGDLSLIFWFYHFTIPRAGLTWPSVVMVEPAWWSITDLLILSLYYTTCRPDLTFVWVREYLHYHKFVLWNWKTVKIKIKTKIQVVLFM